MNIIQAREAAMAGKTVGDFFRNPYIDNWSNQMPFGEWSLKKEPVMFSHWVLESKSDKGLLLLNEHSLSQFAGKRVKVSVEVIDEA